MPTNTTNPPAARGGHRSHTGSTAGTNADQSGALETASGAAGRPSAPPPRQRAPYISNRLHTVAGIRAEICSLYRASRRGLIPSQDCTRWSSVLHLAARLIQGQELEERVRALEMGRPAPAGFAAPNRKGEMETNASMDD